MLKDRQRQERRPDQNIKDTIMEIAESLKRCEVCLQVIEAELDPLDVMGTRARPPDFGKRIKWVCSQAFIRSQQNLIDTHLDNLKLDLAILQSLDQSATLNAVRALTRALTNNASDQQVNLEHLERPDSDGDAPSPVNEPTSDDEDLDEELSKHCPGCQRLNMTIPDAPLAMAVKHRQASKVQQLVSGGHDATIRDPNEWSLLHHSTHLVDVQTTYALLKALSSPEFVDARTRDGYTALMHVAGQADTDGSYDIADELIKRGSDVNTKDHSEDRRTALWWAVDGGYSKNRERLVDFLVDHGAIVTPVRNGKLKNQAKKYAILAEAAEREEFDDDEDDGKDGLKHRLSKVFTNDG